MQHNQREASPGQNMGQSARSGPGTQEAAGAPPPCSSLSNTCRVSFNSEFRNGQQRGFNMLKPTCVNDVKFDKKNIKENCILKLPNNFQSTSGVRQSPSSLRNGWTSQVWPSQDFLLVLFWICVTRQTSLSTNLQIFTSLCQELLLKSQIISGFLFTLKFRLFINCNSNYIWPYLVLNSPIPKKSNAKECSNYHTIALI